MTEATLFLDLDGTSLTQEEKNLLKEPEIGGVILFGRNTESASQVALLIEEIRQINPSLIISIDQEGGRVQRLKNGVALIPAMQTLESVYAKDNQQGLSASREMGYLMASEMRRLDIDISFAPVLDVDYGRNTVIGSRAFATNPQDVTALAKSFISGMREAGMAATGKHFPGHGWADADTHLSGAVDERSFERIWETDLLPFRDAIRNGMEAIMFAHVHYMNCDSDPAGFSTFWIEKILRQKLGFKGLVFSDDLSMKAAHSAGTYKERATQAIAAGCQILLCCNDREGTLDILQYMKESGLSPVSDLSTIRGKSLVTDNIRLDEAKGLAANLLDSKNG